MDNNEILTSFNFDNENLAITFVEEVHVKDGVICHIYEFADDQTRDLGIVFIKPGYKTPKQQIVDGNKTVEGYISGKGKLTVIKADGVYHESYIATDAAPFSMELHIGDTMQWQADENESLSIYEICYPPYQDGRFKNIED